MINEYHLLGYFISFIKILIFLSYTKKAQKKLLALAAVILSIQYFLFNIILNTRTTGLFFFVPDSIVFDNAAIAIAQTLQRGELLSFQIINGDIGSNFFSGFIYKLVYGVFFLLFRDLNIAHFVLHSIVNILIIWLLLGISRTIFGNTHAGGLAYTLISITPSYQYYFLSNQKELWICFVFLLLIYFFLTNRFLRGIFAAIVLFFDRFYLIPFLLVSYWTINYRKTKSNLIFMLLIIIFIGITFFYFSGYHYSMIWKVGASFRTNYEINHLGLITKIIFFPVLLWKFMFAPVNFIGIFNNEPGENTNILIFDYWIQFYFVFIILIGILNFSKFKKISNKSTTLLLKIIAPFAIIVPLFYTTGLRSKEPFLLLLVLLFSNHIYQHRLKKARLVTFFFLFNILFWILVILNG
jgi:hypothetical protein